MRAVCGLPWQDTDSTHARICHARAACGGHLQATHNTRGHARSATCLGRSQTTRARHETRVLQASQQDRAEADEAPIPARRGRACCGRAEPRSRSPSGGRASSAWNENGIADSSPRELTAPLMSLCTELEKHGQHISVRNTTVQPCSCERFHPRPDRAISAALRIPLNIAREAHSLGTEDATCTWLCCTGRPGGRLRR